MTLWIAIIYLMILPIANKKFCEISARTPLWVIDKRRDSLSGTYAFLTWAGSMFAVGTFANTHIVLGLACLVFCSRYSIIGLVGGLFAMAFGWQLNHN